MMKVDVAIIGAGVVGSSIARELSRYRLEVALVEKDADVANGTTKANSAIIHTGFDATPHTLESQLVAQANWMYDDLCNDLQVPFKRVGAILVAINDEQAYLIDKLKEKGEANGVHDLQNLTADQVRDLEPNISPDVRRGMFIPRESIIDSALLCIAYVENAAQNGVQVLLESEVLSIERKNGSVTGLTTVNGFIQAKYVINAAGLYSDHIARMVGLDHFNITPRKGEFFILDKAFSDIVSHIILPVPTAKTKGVLVAPTIDKNIIYGPTADDIEDKSDTSTTRAGLEKIMANVTKLVPCVSIDHTIRQYAGLRAAGSSNEYLIEVHHNPRGFVNVAQIRSTGVTSSAAIGKYVIELLRQDGLHLEKNENFNPRRKAIRKFADASASERENLIAAAPGYGHIVCRCETVSEAEIVQAIQAPVGARNLDAVKKRTRAGTGRCQGGFCSLHVAKTLARELGIPLNAVTLKGFDSFLFDRPTKAINQNNNSDD